MQEEGRLTVSTCLRARAAKVGIPSWSDISIVTSRSSTQSKAEFWLGWGVPQYEHANPKEAAVKTAGQTPNPAPKKGPELVSTVTQLNAMLEAITQHWKWVQTDVQGKLVFNLYTGLDEPKYIGGSVH
jgi:hypothetical protein